MISKLGPIHPKTGGAAIGGTLALVILGALSQAGVHINAELTAALGAFLSAFGAWLFPAGVPASVPITVAPVPAEPVTGPATLEQAAQEISAG